MSRSLVVNRNASDAPPGSGVVDFRDVRHWVRSGSIVKHLFRYDDVLLVTHLLDVMPKPLASAILLRALSHGRSTMADEYGSTTNVTMGSLARLVMAALRDWKDRGPLLARTREDLRRLELHRPGDFSGAVRLDHAPLYVRSDLTFGLTSGGSVGHIAGVVNNLEHFTTRPVFLTTDPIPTVSNAKVMVVRPSGRFRDFAGLAPIAFNATVLHEASRTFDAAPPAFVYQRSSLYDYAGLQFARQSGVPFVLEYNGSEVWASRVWGEGPVPLETWAASIERLNLRHADLCVVVSNVLGDELRNAGVDDSAILVNPNGVDEQRYSPDISGLEARQQLGLEGKLVVGFIGTFGPWHGAESLARAFCKLLHEDPARRADWRLLMIGDGARLAATRAIVEQGGCESEAVFVGRTRQEDGPKYLAACDVLASPHVPNADGSRFFGSPTKLFEYMAMGKGIVASRLEQIGDVLEHDRTAWLVEPGDIDALGDGLSLLLTDQARRERLGSAARQAVVQHHTWREHTRRIVERIQAISRKAA